MDSSRMIKKTLWLKLSLILDKVKLKMDLPRWDRRCRAFWVRSFCASAVWMLEVTKLVDKHCLMWADCCLAMWKMHRAEQVNWMSIAKQIFCGCLWCDCGYCCHETGYGYAGFCCWGPPFRTPLHLTKLCLSLVTQTLICQSLTFLLLVNLLWNAFQVFSS